MWGRERAASVQRGALPNAQGRGLINNRLGSGSDYTVFLNFLGVPIVDMSFDGAYGVYHSIYDDHRWVAQIGDPACDGNASCNHLPQIGTVLRCQRKRGDLGAKAG